MVAERNDSGSPGGGSASGRGFRWWALHAGLSLSAAFFLLFGIDLLVAAYSLADPFYFVMTFFASNLIILISATLLVGFCWRMIASMRAAGRPDA
jgi:hypothetical protein